MNKPSCVDSSSTIPSSSRCLSATCWSRRCPAGFIMSCTFSRRLLQSICFKHTKTVLNRYLLDIIIFSDTSIFLGYLYHIISYIRLKITLTKRKVLFTCILCCDFISQYVFCVRFYPCSFSNCNYCMLGWLSSNREHDSLLSASPFSILLKFCI